MFALRSVLFLLLALLPCAAWGSVGLMMEEPFGAFGYVNPTGHAAIYLSHVCAASPTELRKCGPDEAGVVISRYHHVNGYDWLAVPLVAYLYAVDSIDQIPDAVTPQQESALRDAYRREHYASLIPDGPGGSIPGGEWIQLIGASYDRKIYVFELDAPESKDEQLIAAFNDRSNVGHFNLFFNNCADLSRRILNFYYPKSIHRNIIADVGLTTPKQVARSLTRYAKKHERIEYHSYVIPQVAGTIPRSKQINGVIESFLKKKYVLPVAFFQPVVAGGLAAAYLFQGRYTPGADAEVLQPTDLGRLYSPIETRPTGVPLVADEGQPSLLKPVDFSEEAARVQLAQPALSSFGDSSLVYGPTASVKTVEER